MTSQHKRNELTVTLSADRLLEMVERSVQKALRPPDGLPDITHFLRVEATDQDGKRWRGMLYAVEQEAGCE